MNTTLAYLDVKRAGELGGTRPPTGTEQPPPERFQRRILERVLQALDDETVAGIVLTSHQMLSRRAVQHLESQSGQETQLTWIACSRFSQKIPFGALLFLLTVGEGTAQLGDFEVYRLLRRQLGSAEGAPPPVVLIENAGLLDPASERLLARLVSDGAIRLVLNTEHSGQLGPGFTALLHQHVLRPLSGQAVCLGQAADHLRQLLGLPCSAFAVAHLHALAGGELAELEIQVERLLAEGRLVRTEDAWVIRHAAAQLHLVPDPAQDTNLSAGQARLLQRITHQGTLRMDEIGADPAALESMDALFEQGLVHFHGLGVIEVRERAVFNRSAGIVDSLRASGVPANFDREVSDLANLVGLGSYQAASRRLEELAEEMDRLPGQHRSLYSPDGHYVDALFAAYLGLGDLTKAGQLLQRAGQAAGGHRVPRLDDGYAVYRWYLQIRDGRLPGRGAGVPAPGDWEDLVDDRHWHSGGTRLLGLLCIAYQWLGQGAYEPGVDLLRRALDELERQAQAVAEPRVTLLFAHLLHQAYDCALLARDPQLVRRVHRVFDDSLTSDPLAHQYAAYFRCRELLIGNRGTADRPGDLATLSQMEQAPLGEDEAYLVLLDQWLRPADDAAPLASPEETDRQQLSMGLWETRHRELVLRSGSQPSPDAYEQAITLARQALEQGLGHAARESLLLALAVGQPPARELDEIRDDFGSLLAEHRAADFLQAIREQDVVAEYQLRVELALRLRPYLVEVGTAAAIQRHAAVRRIVQRANASLRAGAEHEATGPSRAEQGAPEAGSWQRNLTARERTIAGYVAKGLRNAEIARHCGISVRTVEGHLYQIHAKLNLRSRRDLRELIAASTAAGAR